MKRGLVSVTVLLGMLGAGLLALAQQGQDPARERAVSVGGGRYYVLPATPETSGGGSTPTSRRSSRSTPATRWPSRP